MAEKLKGPPKANSQKPKKRYGNQKPRIDQFINGDIWPVSYTHLTLPTSDLV